MSNEELPDDIRLMSADLRRLKPTENAIRSDELFYQAGFVAAQKVTPRDVGKPRRTWLYAGLSAVVAACVAVMATAPISYRLGESDALDSFSASVSETISEPQPAVHPSADTSEPYAESLSDMLVAENTSTSPSYLQLFVSSVTDRKPPTTLTAYHGAKWLNEDSTHADQWAGLSAMENSSPQLLVKRSDENATAPFAVRDAFHAFPTE